MAATLLDGRVMAEELVARQAARVAALKDRGVTPCLAVVLVGENPASQIYVRNKGLACARIGMASRTITLPADCAQDKLHDTLDDLAGDPSVHGILLQLPLPAHLNEAEALLRIPPDKDVDGFHVVNAGRLFTGGRGTVACTPKGILHMLHAGGVPLAGREAVVIGRSNIVGKPIAMLLLNENATVTICHSRTQNLAEHTRRADILVAAVGRPRFVTADMVKPGAAVIDVGINRVDGKVVGDVDFDAVREIAGWITPVPGGVGKMTISMLMENTLEVCEHA